VELVRELEEVGVADLAPQAETAAVQSFGSPSGSG
jgi:hypothetical protein